MVPYSDHHFYLTTIWLATIWIASKKFVNHMIATYFNQSRNLHHPTYQLAYHILYLNIIFIYIQNGSD